MAPSDPARKRCRMLTRPEVLSLSEDLRALLTSTEVGDLDATAPMRHRIEGAVTALDAVLGNRPSLAIELASKGDDR